MKKLFAALLVSSALSASIALAGCSVEVTVSDNEPSGTSSITDDMTNYGNPDAVSTFQDYATLEEACKAASTEFVVPQTYADSTSRVCQAASDSGMVQVRYLDEAGNELAFMRKGPAILGDDISGDPKGYPQTVSSTAGDYVVTFRGQDDLVSLATWSTADYSYSVAVKKALPSDQMQALVASIQ